MVTVREVSDPERSSVSKTSRCIKSFIIFVGTSHHVPAAACLQTIMQWRRHVTGLAFSLVFVVSYFTNKVGTSEDTSQKLSFEKEVTGLEIPRRCFE